jgi:hypothetical protein
MVRHVSDIPGVLRPYPTHPRFLEGWKRIKDQSESSGEFIPALFDPDIGDQRVSYEQLAQIVAGRSFCFLPGIRHLLAVATGGVDVPRSWRDCTIVVCGEEWLTAVQNKVFHFTRWSGTAWEIRYLSVRGEIPGNKIRVLVTQSE